MTSRLSSALTQLNTQSIRDINSTTAQAPCRLRQNYRPQRQTYVVDSRSIHSLPTIALCLSTDLSSLAHCVVDERTRARIDTRED